jgi:nitrite reductase/ring-hydroxylating ferredoxin subunit
VNVAQPLENADPGDPPTAGHGPGVVLCAAGALLPGEMMAIELEGLERIALYRVGGAYYASQDTCTHAQASLTEGWLEGDRVGCPAHAAEFCVRTGRALCFPADRPLRVFPVWLEDGAVLADLSGAERTGP